MAYDYRQVLLLLLAILTWTANFWTARIASPNGIKGAK
jgi:hypothetical protein